MKKIIFSIAIIALIASSSFGQLTKPKTIDRFNLGVEYSFVGSNFSIWGANSRPGVIGANVGFNAYRGTILRLAYKQEIGGDLTPDKMFVFGTYISILDMFRSYEIKEDYHNIFDLYVFGEYGLGFKSKSNADKYFKNTDEYARFNPGIMLQTNITYNLGLNFSYYYSFSAKYSSPEIIPFCSNFRIGMNYKFGKKENVPFYDFDKIELQEKINLANAENKQLKEDVDNCNKIQSEAEAKNDEIEKLKKELNEKDNNNKQLNDRLNKLEEDLNIALLSDQQGTNNGNDSNNNNQDANNNQSSDSGTGNIAKPYQQILEYNGSDKFMMIGGVFRYENNAINTAKKLKESDYNNTTIYLTSKGLHFIVIDTYPTYNAGSKEIIETQTNSGIDGIWIFKVRK